MTYHMTTRRKIAIASYAAAKEGNIYAKLSLEVEPVLKYIEKVKEQTGEKITITHFIGKAIGRILSKMPDLNGQIILGKYYPHKTTDLSFLVQIDEGNDLAKVKISNVDKKSLVEVATEIKAGSQKLRQGTDEEYEKSKSLIRILPTWLIRPILYFTGYISGVLGISAKPLGVESYPFGACIITSVGMLGLDDAYAPPTPFCRVPMYITVLEIRDQVVVRNGEITICKMINITATIDHRFIDGFQGSKIAKMIREIFANPELID